MKTMTLAILGLLALALTAAAPASATVLEDSELRINCTGSPTTIPKVDGLYRLGCALVGLGCDLVFDPCILEFR